MSLDINELRRLLAEATPGPWEYSPSDSYCDCGKGCETPATCDDWYTACTASVPQAHTVDCGDYFGLSDNNAALIVAAVNALPALLDRIEKLEGALTKLLDRVDRNGGLGEYKGGPPFVVSEARAALNPTGSKP
jgi:hypothetical protein